MATSSPRSDQMKESWHLMEVKDILKKLGSGKDGLKTSEVERAREKFGENVLAEGKKDPKWLKFLRQFTDVLVIILLIAAVVTAVLQEFVDAVVITIIVMINAIIGYVQEAKAEEAIASLKKMAAPHALVYRDGKKKEVLASELVPGDKVYVESGMLIPADCRIISGHSLKVNEAPLTGESAAVDKSAKVLKGDIPLAERSNLLFMSTLVETGHADAVVTNTGMSTEMGHIAGMLSEVERIETPLQKRLKSLGKKLGLVVLGACILIFALQIVRNITHLTFHHFIETFEISVSLAVAAIPEGLPAVVTISLALGLKVMAKKSVIIRKLPVVETLGSATVICTDKTGTLTTGTMTADVVYIDNDKIDITGTGYSCEGVFNKYHKTLDCTRQNEAFKQVMMAAALCGDATISEERGHRNILGDTTEGAVMVMAEKADHDYQKLRKKYPRTDEKPFDADRKMMTTVHKINGEAVAYTKGAPERVLDVCVKEMWEDAEIDLTEKRREEIRDLTEHLAMTGYRTLGFALSLDGKIEKELTFLGIVGIKDKIRPEAKKAVAKAHKAGIRVLMITGDHQLTATAIGKELGIINKDAEAVNCRILDDMDDKQFLDTIDRVSVYARASPEHKVRIVSGLKSHGHIAAMTGDGVNDAPALKQADIGVAMGITGTDVSKGAADMILTDDNFASIVAAVEEGRGIYDNIRKVIQFLLSCNMSEVLVMLIAIALGWTVPFIALQILWMNLVTDSFPALALVVEPKEPGLMKRKPRDPKESAITKDMWISIFVSAIIITAGTLFLFALNLFYFKESEQLSRTIALTTMVFFQMWTAIACRSTTHSMRDIGWFTNKKLIMAIGLSVTLMIAAIYVPYLAGLIPGVSADVADAINLFETSPLNVVHWAQILTVSVFGLVAVEIWEIVNRKYFHLGAAA